MRTPRKYAITISALAALSVCACGGSSDAVQPAIGDLTRIEVTPDVLSVTTGNSQPLHATAYDTAGQTVAAASFVWESSDPDVASVSPDGRVTGVAPGTATITATSGGHSGTATVTVLNAAQGNTIDVIPQTTYQTMRGWMGNAQIGQFECDHTAYQNYRTELLDRLVNELGINRVAIHFNSGLEHSIDYYDQLLKGQITPEFWRTVRFVPQNDNSDPRSVNPAGFQWTMLDYDMDNVVLPMRQRLAARGEQLYLEAVYIDFGTGTSKPFYHLTNAEEYAEFVTEAFKHVRQKYGIDIDGLEILLEPENTPHRADRLGPAIVAVGDRLKAAGFTPDIVAPSTMDMSNTVPYLDGMLQTPRVPEYLTDLAYHRYAGVSDGTLQLIGQRAMAAGIRTGMLEKIDAGIDALWKDLTMARNSSWMQFSLSYCGLKDNPANGGVYYQINQTVPSAPKVNITDDSKFFRQLFLFVRQGAVRVGASSGNPALLDALAFRNTNGKFVVVVRTTGAAAFDVRGLPAGTYGIMWTTGSSQWGKTYADVTVTGGGTISTSIPAAGVLTIHAR